MRSDGRPPLTIRSRSPLASLQDGFNWDAGLRSQPLTYALGRCARVERSAQHGQTARRRHRWRLKEALVRFSLLQAFTTATRSRASRAEIREI
jgi:hypothetical protein